MAFVVYQLVFEKGHEQGEEVYSEGSFWQYGQARGSGARWRNPWVVDRDFHNLTTLSHKLNDRWERHSKIYLNFYMRESQAYKVFSEIISLLRITY